MRKITHIVVHHNGVPGRTIEDVRRTHVKEKKWSDIGYHFVIHEDGSEHVGRRVSRPGAHVAGFNANTVGVCVIGNGDEADFNEAQYETLTKRLAALCRLFNLDESAVIGHRETVFYVLPGLRTKKACPGRKVDLDALRARVRARLAS